MSQLHIPFSPQLMAVYNFCEIESFFFGPILRSRDWRMIAPCHDFHLRNDECLTMFPSPQIPLKYAIKMLQILARKDIWRFVRLF